MLPMLLDQECGLVSGGRLYFWRSEGPLSCCPPASGAHDGAETSHALPAGGALLYFLAEHRKICHLHCCILCFDSSSSFNGICQNVGHSKAGKQNQWREKLPALSNSSAAPSLCSLCPDMCTAIYFASKIWLLGFAGGDKSWPVSEQLASF